MKPPDFSASILFSNLITLLLVVTAVFRNCPSSQLLLYYTWCLMSSQEFLLAIDVTSAGTPQEKLKWAFRMYDVDGNGVIELNEMKKIVQVILSSDH